MSVSALELVVRWLRNCGVLRPLRVEATSHHGGARQQRENLPCLCLAASATAESGPQCRVHRIWICNYLPGASAIAPLRNQGSAAAGTTSIFVSAKLRTVSEWTKAENALSMPSLKLSSTFCVQPQKTAPQLTSCSEHILLSQVSRNHCQSFFVRE